MNVMIPLMLIASLAMAGCGSPGSDSESAPAQEPGSAGRDVANVVSDTDLLRQAQGAANDIIRNAADCDYVARTAPGVYQTLDEAEGKVQTAAGRQSLDTVRRQVDRIAETCGVH